MRVPRLPGPPTLCPTSPIVVRVLNYDDMATGTLHEMATSQHPAIRCPTSGGPALRPVATLFCRHLDYRDMGVLHGLSHLLDAFKASVSGFLGGSNLTATTSVFPRRPGTRLQSLTIYDGATPTNTLLPLAQCHPGSVYDFFTATGVGDMTDAPLPAWLGRLWFRRASTEYCLEEISRRCAGLREAQAIDVSR